MYDNNSSSFNQDRIQTDEHDNALPLLMSDALAALPDDLRDRLQQAVEEIELHATLQIMDQINSQNPQLADALTELVKQYRFDTLQHLVENMKK